jgi:hypothetical protein
MERLMYGTTPFPAACITKTCEIIMSYAYRMKLRRERARAAAAREQSYALLDAEKVMQAYDAAYYALYQRNPVLSYDRGWYKVNGENVRRSDLVKMTGILQARLHELEIQNEEAI